MKVITNLVEKITQENFTLSDILRTQHGYHEKRRWSVYDVVRNRQLTTLNRAEKAAIWHAAKAELTTQPAGIRLAVQGVRMAQEIAEKNPVGATVLQAAAAWSARYWLEEEAHHEVAYGLLLDMAGLPPIKQKEVVEHRRFFPEDNYARICTMLACIEIEACATYGRVAQTTKDPVVKEIFLRVARDEAQHRQHFIAFARGLVESNVYPAKDVLSMAYAWIRPESGQTYASQRQQQLERQGFVNWWTELSIDGEDELSLKQEQFHSRNLQSKKERSIFAGVYEATGIKVNSIEELQRAYIKSLTQPDLRRSRSPIDRRIQTKAISTH